MSRVLRLARSQPAAPTSPTARIAVIPMSHRLSSSFNQQPSPPRLPPEQQAEFERLQREAEARLYSHTQLDQQQQQQKSPLATSRHVNEPARADASSTDAGATLSGGIRQGAAPEFQGDVNPRTGEVGGPKNEPLRWGGDGDWSYNGRVTDF